MHKGEVLGFFGLIGAGRTEIMEMIFGMRASTGTIAIDGSRVAIGEPSVSDRVIVIKDGRISQTIERAQASQETMEAATA